MFQDNQACPLCKSNNNKVATALKDYKLRHCLDCQMIWEKNPPQNLLNQYDKDYFINKKPKGGYSNYFSGMQINRKTFAKRLKQIIKKIKITGNLLDVGCALGDCLLEAQKLGFKKPLGIDPSAYACKEARKRGLNVIRGTLQTVNLKPESFDIILSQDEIEHLENPVEELKKMYQLLKNGGWLFLVTPDISDWWAKLLGRFWYHYKPGEHLVYFSQKTIEEALKKAGFNNISISKTYHIMSIEYIFNRLCYYSSIFRLFLEISKKLKINEISLLVYTGELEAWAQKKSGG